MKAAARGAAVPALVEAAPEAEVPAPGGSGRVPLLRAHVLHGRVGRLIRPALSTAAAAALLLGLLLAVRQEDWHTLAGFVRPHAIALLTLAMLANLAGLVLAEESWRALLVDAVGPVRFAVAARVYFTGVIAKLAPGRVWTLLIHIRFALSTGVTATRITTVFIGSTLVGLLSGATAGLCVAPTMLGSQSGWLALPTALFVICLIRPDLVERLVALGTWLVRRPSLALSASPPAVRRSLLLGLVSWLVSGLNLWIIALLLGAPAWRALPLCIGGFALATVGGSLVFILPDGWGVRELLLTVALRGELSWSDAAAAAVASRVVVLAGELAGGLLALAYGRLAGRGTRSRSRRQRGADSSSLGAGVGE
jgi:hypothetical protein